jgi:hypothetical protein
MIECEVLWNRLIIIKMRTILIILISIFLISCNDQHNTSISDKSGMQLKDRPQNPPIIIYESEIQLKDRMKFNIINTTKDSIYYIIGIEAKFDSKWDEILMDINGRIGAKIAAYDVFIPYQNLNVEFNIKGLLGVFYQEGNEYRLKVIYKENKLNPSEGEVFSSSFIAK